MYGNVHRISRQQPAVDCRAKLLIQGGPKIGTCLRLINFIKNIDQFLCFSTLRIRRKFVIILSLKIPSHLMYVATLPC